MLPVKSVASKILFCVSLPLLTALAVSLFQWGLYLIPATRAQVPGIIWLLPFAGAGLGVLLTKLPADTDISLSGLTDGLADKCLRLSGWSIPWIIFSSWVTHLFGGSAGREGVGIIIGTALASTLPSKSFASRAQVLGMGVAAGLAAVFLTPFAGVVLALEWGNRELRRPGAVALLILSAGVSFAVANHLAPEHQKLAVVVNWQPQTILPWALALVAVVLATLLYGALYEVVKNQTRRFLPEAWQRLSFGGALVAVVLTFAGTQYAGLGLPLLHAAFIGEVSLADFLNKTIVTALTLGAGFKGGEVTPLFILGAMLAQTLCLALLAEASTLAAALGMMGLVGVVTRAPFTAVVMSAEFFGWEVAVFLAPLLALAQKTVEFTRSRLRRRRKGQGPW